MSYAIPEELECVVFVAPLFLFGGRNSWVSEKAVAIVDLNCLEI